MAEMNDVSPESGSNMDHKDNGLIQDEDDDDDSSDVKGKDLGVEGGGRTEDGDEIQQEDEGNLTNSDNNNNNNGNNSINNNNHNSNINNGNDIKTLLEDTPDDKVRTEEEDDDLSYLYDTIGNNNKNDKSGKKSPLFQDDEWENRVKQLRKEISETEEQHTIWKNNFSARRNVAIEKWKEIKKKKQLQIQKMRKLKNLSNGNEEEERETMEETVTDQTKVE
ncbi:myb-like protein D isoform X1 [Octopus sinensis]|uniref:Myb-like protein D isoform X1 n=1 Tax=Octopus sinensis TaxID=2607531 RepID=A0A6P7SND7_9MOLL|nr:myb-like protein D isoform X1 [Octopus sinensis]